MAFASPHKPGKEITMSLQDSSTQRKESESGSTRRSLRGFAAMDPQRQREIASLGGRAAHQSGHAHEFTSEEARAAGRKRHARNGSSPTDNR
jgi:general stress protein YciG